MRKLSDQLLIQEKVNSFEQVGKHLFSARVAYENYFLEKGTIDAPQDLWQKLDLIPIIQNHWHRRGLNGCVFSQVVATKAVELGWKTLVIGKMIDEIEDKTTAQYLEDNIQQALPSSDVQILSFLFPTISDPQALLRLIRTFVYTVPSIFIEKESRFDDLVTLALRIQLPAEGEKKPNSWLMGFGPFEFLPYTRQAPCTELVIQTKSKIGKDIFHRSNQDRSIAHIADVPTQLDDRIMERLWPATFARTKAILGQSPNQFSAARTTFTLPVSLWYQE